jgi:predicted transcriptional regulator
MPSKTCRTEHVGFRCPSDLIDPLDRLAERQDRTRSNLLTHILRSALRQAGELPPTDERIEVRRAE